MKKTNISSKTESHSQGIGFGTGMLMGTVLGMVGYYMLTTEEGRKLKTKLITKYQEYSQVAGEALVSVDQNVSSQVKNFQKTPVPFQEDIRVKEAKSLLQKLSEQLKTVTANQPVDPLVEEAKSNKRSFTKSGKKL